MLCPAQWCHRHNEYGPYSHMGPCPTTPIFEFDWLLHPAGWEMGLRGHAHKGPRGPLSYYATMSAIWFSHQVDILTTLLQVRGYGLYSFRCCRHPTGQSLHHDGPKYCATEVLHNAVTAPVICLHGLPVPPTTYWYHFFPIS